MPERSMHVMINGIQFTISRMAIDREIVLLGTSEGGVVNFQYTNRWALIFEDATSREWRCFSKGHVLPGTHEEFLFTGNAMLDGIWEEANPEEIINNGNFAYATGVCSLVARLIREDL